MIEEKRYEFHELDESIQTEIINAEREYRWSDGDYGAEWIIEKWQEILEDKGYYDIEINYTGFYSQGDGASFTGECDIQKWLNQKFSLNEIRLMKLNEISLTGSKRNYLRIMSLLNKGMMNITGEICRTNSHYCHERSVESSLTLEEDVIDYNRELDYSNINITINELEEELKEEVLHLCKEIYKDLEESFEEYMSDECIIDYITSSENYYNEEGGLI